MSHHPGDSVLVKQFRNELARTSNEMDDVAARSDLEAVWQGRANMKPQPCTSIASEERGLRTCPAIDSRSFPGESII